MTRAKTRCGCFLPDLTGLARRPSIADLPILRTTPPGVGGKGGGPFCGQTNVCNNRKYGILDAKTPARLLRLSGGHSAKLRASRSGTIYPAKAWSYGFCCRCQAGRQPLSPQVESCC